MTEPEGTADARDAPPARPLRAELGLFLQLVGACGLVFARPILDVFGRSPETFLEADAGWRAIVFFGVFWVVVPPTALWLITFATRVFGARVRRTAHVVGIAALAGIFTVQSVFQAQSWPPWVVWSLGAVAAGLLAWWWSRYVLVREFLAWLSGAPVVFLALFLLSSPVSALVGSDSAHALAAGPHPPIVLIVFDELPTLSLLDPTGHIDPAVYPGFAQLAAGSTWYRNNTSTGATTDKAVPAILTGSYPPSSPTVPTTADYPHNLFLLLGVDTFMHVAETVTHLCPSEICTGGPRGEVGGVIDKSLDVWNERFHHARPGGGMLFDPVAGGERRGTDFQGFIAGITKQPTSRLDFAHVVLPHVPWQLTPSGRPYDPGSDVGESPFYYQWAGDEAARFNRERHLIQLQYADHLIQRLLARLHRIKAYDDSLVVVTADHGIAFTGDVPARTTTPRNIMQIAWSPLFVKTPHQTAGRVDDRNSQTVDVLPTIADVVHARLPWPVDGVSLLGPPRRTTTRYMVPFDQNRIPTDRDGRIVIDGRSGFRELLRADPASRGHDEFALFRGGPEASVVGRAVTGSATGAPADGSATLEPRALVVPRGKGPLPIVVRAAVDTPGSPVVALTVDGTVVGTYRPRRDGKARFVVPEAVLGPGRHALALWTVSGAGADATLRRLDTGETRDP
jgi:hypothetical protein